MPGRWRASRRRTSSNCWTYRASRTPCRARRPQWPLKVRLIIDSAGNGCCSSRHTPSRAGVRDTDQLIAVEFPGRSSPAPPATGIQVSARLTRARRLPMCMAATQAIGRGAVTYSSRRRTGRTRKPRLTRRSRDQPWGRASDLHAVLAAAVALRQSDTPDASLHYTQNQWALLVRVRSCSLPETGPQGHYMPSPGQNYYGPPAHQVQPSAPDQYAPPAAHAPPG
jgi:hypothetical protein